MSGWLGKSSPAVKEAFLEAGVTRRYRIGENVFDFGDDGRALFGVVSGVIRIWVAMNEQEPRLCHVVGPGFWFGEPPLITGQSRLMKMTAASETVLLSVSQQKVIQISERHPETWQAIALLAVMNQGTAIGAAEDLMISDASKRLIAVLLRFSSHRNAFQGNPPITAIPVSQSELAEAANLSRSSTAARLAQLKREGVIDISYGKIRVLDPGRLRAGLTQ